MVSSLSIIRCVLGTPTRALGCLGRRTTAMHNPKASLAVTAVIKILPAPALLFVANIKELLHEPEIAEDVDQFLSTTPKRLVAIDALNRRVGGCLSCGVFVLVHDDHVLWLVTLHRLGWHLATYEPRVPCWSCREKPGSCRNSCRLQHVARCAGFSIIPHYTYVFEACLQLFSTPSKTR